MNPEEMPELDPEIVLPQYRGLLLKLASALTTDKNLREDLVQEGYIEMWKALKTFDPSRGYLPGWLKYKAKGRMLLVLERQTFLGQNQRPAPGHQGFWDASPVGHPAQDSFLDEDSLIGLEAFGVAESLEYVAYKYHHGEIMEALNSLTPIQRDYVVRRFWYGQTNEFIKLEVEYQPEGAWKQARVNLKKKLSNLAAAI